MEKITISELARLLGFKIPQTLFAMEKSGKFNPDKNLMGKVILKDEFLKYCKEGYQPLYWNSYIEKKHSGEVEEVVAIVDFYDIPVVFIKPKERS